MTDPADRADDEIEHELAEALRQRKPAGPQPNGFCHWCGDAVGPAMRWCPGADCERDWEYAEGRARQNGHVE